MLHIAMLRDNYCCNQVLVKLFTLLQVQYWSITSLIPPVCTRAWEQSWGLTNCTYSIGAQLVHVVYDSSLAGVLSFCWTPRDSSWLPLCLTVISQAQRYSLACGAWSHSQTGSSGIIMVPFPDWIKWYNYGPIPREVHGHIPKHST